MNREMLEMLFKENKINVKRSNLFDTPISLENKDKLSFDKIEGMMLGLAIGDALGITTEGKLPEKRQEMYGEIKDYLPNKYTGLEKGYPSDDTQLAFWTLETLNEDEIFVPEHVASAFCNNGKIFGIGATIRDFLHNFKDQKMPWYEAGIRSAGNGALMRIAPMIIPHLKDNNPNLWIDTALCTMMTHNDSAAISSSEAFVYMLFKLVEMNSAPSAMWWIETYVSIAKDLENDTYQQRFGQFPDYNGTLWNFVEEKVPQAYKEGLSVLEANDLWGSGAYLLETLPMALYILMKYADDPEQAIIRAVNDTKDNDTIAAIVGAAVGALHGKKKLPQRWIENLTGRTNDHDDGKIFKDIEKTKKVWWD